MSVYVGIDVHRKRSQVAVIDPGGRERPRAGASGTRSHPLRGKPVILQPLHQPAGAVAGLERRPGRPAASRRPLQIGCTPLGTFRFDRTCPAWSIGATCERLGCTSIPTKTDIAGPLSELDVTRSIALPG